MAHHRVTWPRAHRDPSLQPKPGTLSSTPGLAQPLSFSSEGAFLEPPSPGQVIPPGRSPYIHTPQRLPTLSPHLGCGLLGTCTPQVFRDTR